MGNVGDKLRQAREAKGMSLEHAAESTKIRAKYLAALEDEEYDVIPGKVYVKGFLKNYANFLGLDSEELMLEYKSKMAPSTASENRVARRVTEQKKYKGANSFIRKRHTAKWQKWLATGILAVAAVTTLVVFNGEWKSHFSPGGSQPQNQSETKGNQPDANKNNQNNQNNKAASQKPDNQAPGGSTGAVVYQPPQDANPNDANTVGTDTGNVVNPNGVQVVLKTKDQNCWVKVIVDNQPIFTGTMVPGESKTFDGKEQVNLVLGNAGAVDVTLNGKELGALGPVGTVIKKEFTKSM